MTADLSLYERAAPVPHELRPLWHMDDEKAIFAGPLDHNAYHAHNVPVYVVGIHGSFGLRVGGGAWQCCRTAIIPAGVAYEFNVGGNPISVIYVEPTIAGATALTPLVRNWREENGALIGSGGEVALMRELYEDPTSADWAEMALADLLGFARRKAPDIIDPRVSRVVSHLYGHHEDLAPVAQMAAGVGLSASRFQHLFTREIGVPYRRFRGWCRMRVAIREILKGSNFTAAAHAAGYADQPHFAHDFRRTFGAPASRGLQNVRK
jgi:AraC-like DNA-binding protein